MEVHVVQYRRFNHTTLVLWRRSLSRPSLCSISPKASHRAFRVDYLSKNFILISNLVDPSVDLALIGKADIYLRLYYSSTYYCSPHSHDFFVPWGQGILGSPCGLDRCSLFNSLRIYFYRQPILTFYIAEFTVLHVVDYRGDDPITLPSPTQISGSGHLKISCGE